MLSLVNILLFKCNRSAISLDLSSLKFQENDQNVLDFMYPCIVSIIVNDDQQDATILAYLFIPNQLYVFRAMSSPSSGARDRIYSFWYCSTILLLAGVMDEMELLEFHLIHDTSRQ